MTFFYVAAGIGLLILARSGILWGGAQTRAHPVAAMESEDPFPLHSPRINALSLPAAFAVAWLAGACSQGVLPYGAGSLFHELGHALAAWATGSFAIPVPFLTIAWPGISPLAILLWQGACALAVRRGLRERSLDWTAAGLSAAAIQLALVAGLSEKTRLMCFIFGGSAGEIVLSAATAMLFYHDVSTRLRWDFWRWPLLLLAAAGFLQTAAFWSSARGDADRALGKSTEYLDGRPISRSGSSVHDAPRLILEHGWAAEELVDAYAFLAGASTLGIAGHYLWFLIPARKKEPEVPAQLP